MTQRNTEYFNKLLKNLKLIIFDECHNISAKTVFNFFKVIKEKTNAVILGLSATPMRTNKKAQQKTHEIFSLDNQNVNILFSFDLFKGIQTETILPFKIIKYEFKGTIIVNNENTNNIDEENDYEENDYEENDYEKNDIDDNINKREKIDKIGFEDIEYTDKDTQYNQEIVKDILENKVLFLPYIKGIGFCKNIKSANEWKQYLNKKIKIIKIYITHSGNKDIPEEDEYNDFKNLKPENNNKINAFLIAVGRCSEGCDIDYLDFGICLDPVKNTDIVVMLQKFGRLTRTDNEDITKRKKEYALIFDTYIEQSNKKMDITIESVISYYNSFLQNNDKKSNDYKTKLLKLYDDTHITNNNNNNKIEIRITIDNNKNHDTIILWNQREDTSFEKFKNLFDKKISVKIKENIKDDKLFFETEYKKLRNKISKKELNNKSEYKKYAEHHHFELNPETVYKNYGWINYYDFLNIDTELFPKSLEELKQKIKSHKIRTEREYNKKCLKYNLPSMPEEFYKTYRTFDELIE